MPEIQSFVKLCGTLREHVTDNLHFPAESARFYLNKFFLQIFLNVRFFFSYPDFFEPVKKGFAHKRGCRESENPASGKNCLAVRVANHAIECLMRFLVQCNMAGEGWQNLLFVRFRKIFCATADKISQTCNRTHYTECDSAYWQKAFFFYSFL